MGISCIPCCVPRHAPSYVDSYDEISRQLGSESALDYISNSYLVLSDSSPKEIAEYTSDLIYVLSEAYFDSKAIDKRKYGRLYTRIVHELVSLKIDVNDLLKHEDSLSSAVESIYKTEAHRRIFAEMFNRPLRYSESHRKDVEKRDYFLELCNHFERMKRLVEKTSSGSRTGPYTVYHLTACADWLRA